MLVTSSQSSTQRPLGLSVEELFALDRQYRRIEQQQQHLSQLQTQARITSSNLNRLTSRSLDLISSTKPSLTVLPSLEVHGHGYSHRSQQHQPSSSVTNYPRSHSIDHLRYTPAVLSTPPQPSLLKPTYHQRSTTNDIAHQNYHPRHRTYLQHPTMTSGTTQSLGNTIMYDIPSPITDHYDTRVSCKLRRQHPIKRESSRRIVVRPVVHRRREPSISSSCESLDELYSPIHRIPTEQSNTSNQSVSFTPSTSLIADVINDLNEETSKLLRTSSNNDSLSDDSDINLYEMRLSIGKTYDTSDISVQLEGPKILIHCHTIEPTDKRGNYRKHEFKTELLVPDVVDDETIVAYLTEDGELIVEGKYQPWAWKEIKKKRKIEKQEINPSSSPILSSTSPPPPPPTPPLPTTTTIRNDGDLEQTQMSPSLISNNNNRIMYNNNNNPMNVIEKLDNNRTVIHVGESTLTSEQYTDTKSVSDIINRFNTFNTTSTLWDGQYRFTNDNPSLLIYHLRLPFETLMDSVRIQTDPQLNILKIFIEQQERSLLPQQQQNKVIIRSTSRICRLPRDHSYDFTHLRVIFLKDNFIRIELPTLH